MTGQKAPDAPLALTQGDPGGIGPEIALKAWLNSSQTDQSVPPFFLIGDAQALTERAQALALPVAISEISNPAEALELFPRALPVLHQPLSAPLRLGEADPAQAPCTIRSIETAVAFAGQGHVCGLVTNPIHKKALYGSGFAFPGHTEFIAALRAQAGAPAQPVMLLAVPGLRVALATIHVPLKEVPQALAQVDLTQLAKTVLESLQRDFAVARPRLAVAGLNPHAGEEGALGDEENSLIRPAVERLQRDGHTVTGPLPADTLFHERARSSYDGVLAMYHDQGLVPLKTIDFDRGVNVTLGLDIVRTSPDHGTAHDIAEKGIARPDSLIEALKLARQIASNRAAFDAMAASSSP